MCIRDRDCLVGGCEIYPIEKEKEVANLSYWILPDYRRHGIATRVVSIACKTAPEYGITRLEIRVDKDNTASRRVAVKNGFVQSGNQDGRACYYWNLREWTRSKLNGWKSPKVSRYVICQKLLNSTKSIIYRLHHLAKWNEANQNPNVCI